MANEDVSICTEAKKGEKEGRKEKQRGKGMWKRKREGSGKGNAPKSCESDNNLDLSQKWEARGRSLTQARRWPGRKHSSVAWTKFYRR
jgi:hypothetical protein